MVFDFCFLFSATATGAAAAIVVMYERCRRWQDQIAYFIYMYKNVATTYPSIWLRRRQAHSMARYFCEKCKTVVGNRAKKEKTTNKYIKSTAEYAHTHSSTCPGDRKFIYESIGASVWSMHSRSLCTAICIIIVLRISTSQEHEHRWVFVEFRLWKLSLSLSRSLVPCIGAYAYLNIVIQIVDDSYDTSSTRFQDIWCGCSDISIQNARIPIGRFIAPTLIAWRCIPHSVFLSVTCWLRMIMREKSIYWNTWCAWDISIESCACRGMWDVGTSYRPIAK